MYSDEEIGPEIDQRMPAESSTYSIVSYQAKKLPDLYQAMIFSKWLRSLRKGNHLFAKIGADAYFREYHQYIERLLEKPSSTVKLAVLTDDPDVVLGFSVSREDVLDYIHVHYEHRKRGVAKQLLPEGITTITHVTNDGINIWQSKYKHLKFNPFA